MRWTLLKSGVEKLGPLALLPQKQPFLENHSLTLPVEEISRSCKEHENYCFLNLAWKYPAYKLVTRAMVWKDQKMT